MLRLFENFDLGRNCFEKKKGHFLKFLEIFTNFEIRDSNFVALLILRHFIYVN